jgi:hypothetical protein
MKTNNLFYKHLIVAVLSILAVYLFTMGEFIVSSALFCTAFIVSNLVYPDSLRT